jgi:hypothetical protein
MTTVVAAFENDPPYGYQAFLAGQTSLAEGVPMNAIGVQPNTLLVEDGVSTLTLGAPGTGYHVDDIVTLVQASASACRVRVLTVDAGAIATWELVTPGEGYTVANGLATTVAPSGGADATFNVTAVADRTVIETFTITKSEADVVTTAAVDSSNYTYEIEDVTYAPEDVSSLTFA